MKIGYAVLGVTAGAVLFLAGGCSKQEPTTETPKSESQATERTTPAEPAPAAAAVGEAQKAVEAAKPATEQAASAAATTATQTAQAVSEAQKSVPAVSAAAATAAQTMQAAATQAVASATSTATTQVQGLIEKAKGLVSNQKYQDALTVVQQLSSLQLTPDQQKLVDGLKAQIQSALAASATSNAASALGNILGGKK